MTLFSDTMPKSPEPTPMLSYFLLVAMAYSTVLCIVAILIMRIYYKNDKTPIPRWLVRLVVALSFQCCRCKEKSNMKMTGVSDVHNMQELSTSKKNEDECAYNIEDWRSLATELDKVVFVYAMLFIVIVVLTLLLSLC